MGDTEKKDELVKPLTQDKLALRDYTNQAVGPLKNKELDAIKSSILGAVKNFFGIGKK